MARISVVVPTCNKKDMVTEAIDSVFGQSFRDFELIIVDDGSTDGTPVQIFSTFGAQPQAIEELSRMHPTAVRPFSHPFLHDGIPVWYHYYPNRGLAAARNRGIRCSRGAYVAFLEAEDLWDGGHLLSHMRFHEGCHEAAVSHSAVDHVKERGRPRKARKDAPLSGWIFDRALEASPVRISAAMAHKLCFQECGVFDENLPACEDYDLWLRMSAHFPFYHVEGPLVRQRSARPQGARTWSWDRYRVYALEKAFQGGRLNPEQRLMVASEIVRKCEHLVEGFTHLKTEERASFYERKRKRFVLEVRKLRASQSGTPLVGQGAEPVAEECIVPA
ncbi:MAG: glycosyltransferase, partial [Candidatus Eisenbacteria bacterium]|nr:glycosyltransferase [Candidatus Eisenbacteria bacterium]